MNEIFQLTSAYIGRMLGLDYTKTSMRDFTKNFTNKTIDYIDRLCVLTDGSKIDTYSVDKFLQLVNQQVALHNLYQPRTPNDIGMFRIWKEQLVSLGVKIITNAKVVSLIADDTQIKGVKYVSNDSNANNKQLALYCDNVILAIPPRPLYELISKLRPQIPILQKSWVENNSYIDYITIEYEWDKKIQLESIWGFPATSWGVAHIVLSDYFENFPGTLISVGVTKVDSENSEGLTARNATKDQLKAEVLKQLKESYPNIPDPDSIVVGSYIGQETAYVRNASDPSFLPFELGIKGLYNAGTQNGKSQYAYTSMESAVVNAHALAHMIEPNSKRFQIINAWTLNGVLLVILLIIIIISSVYYYRKVQRVIGTKIPVRVTASNF